MRKATMIVPSFAVCGLFLAATAGLLSAHGARDAAVARAAPMLAALIPEAALAENDDVTGIVVLGGGVRRVREAIKLAKRYPLAAVLLTGPGEAEIALASSDNSVLPRLMLDLRARNTYENALFSKSLAQPKPGQRWVLVTSAVHMPRALTVFCSTGFEIEPWPVHDTPTESGEAAQQVQHELLGLLAYRLLGRTRDLVRSPSQRCA